MAKVVRIQCPVSGKTFLWTGKGRRPQFHESVTAKQRRQWKTTVALGADKSSAIGRDSVVRGSRAFAERAFHNLAAKAQGCGPIAAARFQTIVSGVLAALNVYRLVDIPASRYAVAADLFIIQCEIW